MKRFSLWTGFVFAGFFTVQGAACADTLEATVVSVDTNSQTLSVERKGSAAQGEELKVTLSGQTKMSGVQALAHIKPGDPITVEGEQNFFTRAWKARALQVPGAPSVETVNSDSLAPLDPSPSLTPEAATLTAAETVVTPAIATLSDAGASAGGDSVAETRNEQSGDVSPG